MIGASYQGRDPFAMVERLLIVRGGALGDFVLTLPVLEAAAGPGRVVDLCGTGDGARLAAADGVARAVERLDDSRWGGVWSGGEPGPLARELRRYDRVVVLRPIDAIATAEQLAACGVGQVVVHDPRPPNDGSVHAADHLLAATGGTCARAVPRLPAHRFSERGRDVLRAAGVDPESAAVLFPGAGGEHKRWPLRRFLALADILRGHGWRPVVVGGPVEAERLGQDLAQRTEAVAPYLAISDVLELAALCASARVVVGNDSGPGHLAAALGTPVVSLFGPTDERTWGPRGSGPVRILRGGGAGDGRPTPMDALAVGTVAAAVVELAVDGRSGRQ